MINIIAIFSQCYIWWQDIWHSDNLICGKGEKDQTYCPPVATDLRHVPTGHAGTSLIHSCFMEPKGRRRKTLFILVELPLSLQKTSWHNDTKQRNQGTLGDVQEIKVRFLNENSKTQSSSGQVYKAAIILYDIQTHLHFGKDYAYFRKVNLGMSDSDSLHLVWKLKADSTDQFNLELLNLS